MTNIFEQFGSNSTTDIALQQQWNELKHAIANHNVIPVIGPNLQIKSVATPIGETTNAQQVLLSELAKYLHLQKVPSSFSELLYDYPLPKGYDRRYIYAQLTQLFQGDLSSVFQPHPGLIKLLQTKQFPFVITTCFTPMVEQVMHQVWGERLKVRIFDNDPKTHCDLDTEAEMDTPTVFYMFGKASNPREGSFVVTDGDMLSFCQSWMDDAHRPRNLVNLLQNKYLLMLGTDYSDWLCRFVLHSMKPNKKTGMLAGVAQEDSLMHFLRRMDNFIQTDATKVIDELCSQIEISTVQNDALRLNTDVFISYSRRDNIVAEALYKALSERGVNVWMDRRSLLPGSDFMREIRRAITTTKLFIPILSHNITAERNDSHTYRLEWDVAATHAISLGREFIIPIVEEGFDFYNAQIPEALQRHNAAMYNPGTLDLTSFAGTVQSILKNH